MENVDHRQQVTEIDAGQLETALEQHLRLHWHDLLKKHGMQARQLLRKLLPERERLRFTARHEGREKWYVFTGRAAGDRVLAGSLDLQKHWRPQRDLLWVALKKILLHL